MSEFIIKNNVPIDNLHEGQEINISQDKFLFVSGFDIRVFHRVQGQLLQLNTYPNDPRVILKLLFSIWI